MGPVLKSPTRTAGPTMNKVGPAVRNILGTPAKPGIPTKIGSGRGAMPRRGPIMGLPSTANAKAVSATTKPRRAKRMARRVARKAY